MKVELKLSIIIRIFSIFNKQKIKALMDNAILALRVVSEIWMKYFEHISAFNPAEIK